MRRHYWLLEIRDKSTGKITTRKRSWKYSGEDAFICALARYSENKTGLYEKIRRYPSKTH